MPYWLSLLADLSARNGQPGAARAILDAALAAAQERDDVWWLPEVMRMRAAYDEGAGGAARDCTPPRGWRLPTAASRCCGAASTTSARGAPAPGGQRSADRLTRRACPNASANARANAARDRYASAPVTSGAW